MNKIYYRWACIKPGAGSGLNDVLVAGGYHQFLAAGVVQGGLKLPAKRYTSVGAAIAAAQSQNRRLQANGQDSRYKVFGEVFDTNNKEEALAKNHGLPDDLRPRPQNRVRELQISGDPPLEESREQVYCDGDTPDAGLTHFINLSNRDSNGGGALDFSADVASDAEDTTVF